MYGLLGRKLGHSLSPQIHSLLGTCPYELFCREPDELADFFADETKRAFNVTIPYKVEAFNACGELSPTARRAGSVNTVVRRPDGTLYGDNTDYFGFLYMAESCGASFKNKKVVVLGSGGASRTVVTVSQDGGAGETVVVSRSGKDNYENLSRHFDADILVNTTPVGMFPDCPKRLVDLSKFTRLECVLDLIYNPCRTQLLADAQELGIPCANGLKMLVAQAVRSAEVFTGKSFGDEIINDVYKRILSEQKNIVLIGMPGCGKTTAGKIIAEKTGRNFLDTDEEIEKKTGRKIPEIFSSDGEEAFRKIEAEAVNAAGKQLGKVIATGGGAVLKKENRLALKQNGTVIYLKKDVGGLALDGRPLSKSADAVKEIYEARRAIYEELADFTVEVDLNAALTAERVLKCVF